MKYAKTAILCLASALCLTFPMSRAWSQEDLGSAREITGRWNDVVITAKVVTRLRVIVEGREMNKTDNEIETVATVIDPSGLAVLSSSSIDPARIYREVLKQARTEGEGMPKFNVETEISDIKMLLPDGSELSAKIVMKDSDLDLAFIKPVTKLDKPVHALDLSRESKPDILDNIIILTRLGTVAGRIPSVSMHRIEAIIRKPRTFYVIGQDIFQGKLGAPVFSLDGKVVGIFLLRVTRSEQKSSFISNILGVNTYGMMPVILPSEEIAAIAKQALEIKDKAKDEK